jgi:Domain of unknown function (DUF4352)
MTDPNTPETGSPVPPRKRHRLRNFVVLPVLGAIGFIAAILVIVAVAGTIGSSRVTTPATFSPSPAPSFPVVTHLGTAPMTDPGGSTCPQLDGSGYCPGDDPSPSAPAPLTGPVGTTYTVTSTDSGGNQVQYSVTAGKVLDPATGADQFTTPDAGKRFVGVRFSITGISGYSSDDSNNDAVILGSDGQTYQPDFSTISAGTNFNSGDFGVRAGQTQVGWVTFQVPDGVSVSSVQWQPGLSDQQPATWTTGS